MGFVNGLAVDFFTFALALDFVFVLGFVFVIVFLVAVLVSCG